MSDPVTKPERWRDVIGYEGFYQVSDLGRVRSLDREDRLGRPIPGRALVGCSGGQMGYRLAHLCRDGVRSAFYYHRLVLEHFVGPCPSGMQACHNDGDHRNNCLSNLRWDSCKSNHLDKAHHGTSPAGERAPWAKLTNAQAREIRRLSAAGVRRRDLQGQFGVSGRVIARVVTGATYV